MGFNFCSNPNLLNQCSICLPNDSWYNCTRSSHLLGLADKECDAKQITCVICWQSPTTRTTREGSPLTITVANSWVESRHFPGKENPCFAGTFGIINVKVVMNSVKRTQQKQSIAYGSEAHQHRNNQVIESPVQSEVAGIFRGVLQRKQQVNWSRLCCYPFTLAW